MSVILLTGDLMVVSHVQGAAARSGVAVQVVSNSAEAASLAASAEVERLIVDLATPAIDLAPLVEQWKAHGPALRSVIAFGPHVHEDRLEAARRAGCNSVMSRGQFFSQVDAVLRS